MHHRYGLQLSISVSIDLWCVVVSLIGSPSRLYGIKVRTHKEQKIHLGRLSAHKWKAIDTIASKIVESRGGQGKTGE